jgi:hypothetical protein
LISKLFTLGLDTTTVRATARSATLAMLLSILTARTETRGHEQAAPATALKKSPAVSLVVRPAPAMRRLTEIGAERRSFAV